MTGAVSNQQIPLSNAFKPGPSAPEQVLQNKDRFDLEPKTNAEASEVRLKERSERIRAEDSEVRVASYGNDASSSPREAQGRGGNLDITV